MRSIIDRSPSLQQMTPSARDGGVVEEEEMGVRVLGGKLNVFWYQASRRRKFLIARGTDTSADYQTDNQSLLESKAR